MMKREDMEPLEQEVRPWLEKMGIPLENYRYLSPSYKVLLHGQVCTPTHPASEGELRSLYRKLHSSEIRAEGYNVDAADFVTHEELQKFFSPLPPSETLSDWEKY